MNTLDQMTARAQREADQTREAQTVVNLNRAGSPLYALRDVSAGDERIVATAQPRIIRLWGFVGGGVGMVQRLDFTDWADARTVRDRYRAAYPAQRYAVGCVPPDLDDADAWGAA